MSALHKRIEHVVAGFEPHSDRDGILLAVDRHQVITLAEIIEREME